MKNTATFLILALLMVSAVSATTTTLSDDELSMAYTDVRVVEFCISDSNGPMDVTAVVDPICRDANSLVGCQAGEDDFSPAGFSAVPNDATTGADGCVNVTLTTSIADPANGGTFYYTVNGQIGSSTVGSETGSVLVPEFGILAAIGVLIGAGIYISRKHD